MYKIKLIDNTIKMTSKLNYKLISNNVMCLMIAKINFFNNTRIDLVVKDL